MSEVKRPCIVQYATNQRAYPDENFQYDLDDPIVQGYQKQLLREYTCVGIVQCKACNHTFGATYSVRTYMDPYTMQQVFCPECRGTKLRDVETLQVG